ncbi:energy-coupling factor transporter transmembrane component T family protein [Corynebacterium ammoniagenes]|uniref:Cobalt transport protein n=1 Tax=Corynebacterium ammoniagenes DSM 20306 TaxID=649754 RepID=A0ABP2IBY6_CORAM|nr:energy-coupling factor transporter transmembrane component T [Corynebacterium ammoniagenes]APT81808.1 ABC transporter [Corynebacterium ammoniagenes DSM 20306]AQS72925.1 ABC transporter [Corynebacterium ammoniagenes]EFG81074.1 cobalt transport protein [Corynebacterium ammoniagenes DSM 20306]
MPNVLSEVNPLTRLALILVLTTPQLLSVDWVSAAVSLAITFMCAPLCGVGIKRLLAMSWPLFIIAPISGVSMLLYAQEGGREYFSFWLATVTDNSIELALAMMLRVLAVALPVIVLARDIDPTELGDALAQILKLPPRFVIGAVAGVRMLTLFKEDWHAMAQARRARGLADRGKIAHLASMSFGLLVLALRRGGKLATAMEARGFARPIPGGGRRTWARESRLVATDWWVMLAGVILASLPVLVSVVTDSWRFLGL